MKTKLTKERLEEIKKRLAETSQYTIHGDAIHCLIDHAEATVTTGEFTQTDADITPDRMLEKKQSPSRSEIATHLHAALLSNSVLMESLRKEMATVTDSGAAIARIFSKLAVAHADQLLTELAK